MISASRAACGLGRGEVSTTTADNLAARNRVAAASASASAAARPWRPSSATLAPPSLRNKFANEPLLPHPLFTAFDHLLGPALIITGLMLLLGLGTRLSLFAQGLIYTTLTVGLILIRQDDGISWLGIHIALVAFALALAKHNKFALLKKW